MDADDRPVVLVRMDGCLGETLPAGAPPRMLPVVRPGAITFVNEVAEFARVVVAAERPRHEIEFWCRTWGIRADDCCDLRIDRPPGVAAVVDPVNVAIVTDPGYLEFELAAARARELVEARRSPPPA